MGGGGGRHSERGEHRTLAVSTPLSGAVIEGAEEREYAGRRGDDSPCPSPELRRRLGLPSGGRHQDGRWK
jgi:hypothetical protein